MNEGGMRRLLKMLSRLSSIGRTKQAANWPRRVPAFINAGELGRNSSRAMAS
jgi:hypothetical protein